MARTQSSTTHRKSKTKPRRRSSREPAAIILLKKQHAEVDKLFKRFEKAKNGDKAEIVQTACRALTIHAQLEEEIFYPALREAGVKNDLLDYVDHSCEPNSVFDVDRLAMVALRRIERGEAITFFYPGAEVELAMDFDCQCGSPDCIGHLKGGFYLTARQMRRALDRGYCTRFMQEQFRRLLELPHQA